MMRKPTEKTKPSQQKLMNFRPTAVGNIIVMVFYKCENADSTKEKQGFEKSYGFLKVIIGLDELIHEGGWWRATHSRYYIGLVYFHYRESIPTGLGKQLKYKVWIKMRLTGSGTR